MNNPAFIFFQSIPAVPYFTIVAQFAYAHKIKFFTYQEQVAAMKVYNEQAKILN